MSTRQAAAAGKSGTAITIASPGQFDQFAQFRARASQRQREGLVAVGETVTPREALVAAVAEANTVVAAEVLDRVRNKPPVFLEQLVLRLLTKMGYGGPESAEHLGRSGDSGLDGVIRQNKLGLDRIYVQAKRHADPVGRPDMQAFMGALHRVQTNRGVFSTTSRLTADAQDYAERVPARLVFIDGAALVDLMVEHNVGVQADETFVLSALTRTSSTIECRRTADTRKVEAAPGDD